MKLHVDPVERFRSYVAPEPNSGCFLWLGGVSKGYGMTRFRGRHEAAHRVAWRVFIGDIPAGLFVLHRCDNPLCVNPQHLFLGTHTENVRDMIAKGRDRGPSTVHRAQTVCQRGHQFSLRSTGKRLCRVCQREAMRRARQRRKCG